MEETVVITGGGRGIGRATAAQLTGPERRVVALVRRPPAEPVPGVTYVHGDLQDVGSTRAAAAALADACPRIDVLVHNAGIWPSRRELTADGVEQAFQTNHLAPFLLTHLLEPRLGRIVQVSAGIYVKGEADPLVTAPGERFHAMRTYADTKLCNLLLLPRWAERLDIVAVHPGVIRTDLGARTGPLGLALKAVKRFWTPVDEGARPVVRLVTDPQPTGTYFEVDEPKNPEPIAKQPELAARLWSQAAHLTGVAESPEVVA